MLFLTQLPPLIFFAPTDYTYSIKKNSWAFNFSHYYGATPMCYCIISLKQECLHFETLNCTLSAIFFKVFFLQKLKVVIIKLRKFVRKDLNCFYAI